MISPRPRPARAGGSGSGAQDSAGHERRCAASYVNAGDRPHRVARRAASTLDRITSASTQSGADGRFEFAQRAAGHATRSRCRRIGYIFVRRRIDVGEAPFESPCRWRKAPARIKRPSTSRPSRALRHAILGVVLADGLGSAGLQALRGVATDDPVRALQALPGAATGDDFQAQFSVRGSAFRHIGFVIDSTATPLLLSLRAAAWPTPDRSRCSTPTSLSRGALIVGPHTAAARRLGGRHPRIRHA